MTNNNQIIWDAIAAVLNGDSTIEQSQVVENWLDENDRNHLIFNNLKALGYNSSMEKASKAKARVFGVVQQKITESHQQQLVRLWQYVAAASIALFLTISSIYVINYKHISEVAIVETKSPFGVRSQIILPDNTVVNLNAGSTLLYPSHFRGKERKVTLIGEAYFEVTENHKHPFLVHAGGINIKVLGTHFNVKAYTDEDKVVTSLLEGSVSIGKKDMDDDEIILRPNQQAIYTRGNNAIKVQEVKAGLFASWKEGGYYFDGETLDEIVRSFERGFNVAIDVQSEKLKKEVFSGIFDRGESIRQILDIMKKHRNFDYKINADSIVIFANEEN